MARVAAPPIRRAPWGRRGSYVSIPVVSVLLVVATFAAADVIGTQFTLFDDGALTLTARVDHVSRVSGPSGKIKGVLTVTNGHAFGIRITDAVTTIRSGTFASGAFTADGNVELVIDIASAGRTIFVASGETVKVPFPGKFTGNLLLLTAATDFRVEPSIAWTEVHPTGDVGPFSYTQTRVCQNPLDVVGAPAGDRWNAACAP